MIRFTTLYFIVFTLPLYCSNTLANTILYLEQTSWVAAVTEYDELVTTSTNIALAEEVTTAPPRNTNVGSVLTFLSSTTGLTRSFKVETLQDGANFTFDDDEVIETNLPEFDNALSIGDIDNFEDDDWLFTLLEGEPINAFSFDLRDDFDMTTESLELLDAGGSVIASVDLTSVPPQQFGGQFVGITSSVFFSGVRFNEDTGGDDIAIADLRFGTSPIPAPSTAFLAAFGVILLNATGKKKISPLPISS